MRSSPKRICGFMTPAEATTSPLDRSHKWAAMVVEPMLSTASPYADPRSSGHTPMICRLSPCTATVTCQPPARKAGCRTCSTARSQPRFFRPHSISSASNNRRRSPDGSCMSGCFHLKRSAGRTTGLKLDGARIGLACARPGGAPGCSRAHRSRHRRERAPSTTGAFPLRAARALRSAFPARSAARGSRSRRTRRASRTRLRQPAPGSDRRAPARRTPSRCPRRGCVPPAEAACLPGNGLASRKA